MTSRVPVSVFIIAKNEADRIPHAIKSVVGWADEVHVIDSGSTDKTVEISRELGANVVCNPWPGYGPQKVFGESLCRNHWLLNIDADEEVTPALRDEIISLFADGKEPPLKAYGFPIEIVHFLDENGALFGRVVHPERLYDKRVAGFKSSTVHDSVEWKSRAPQEQFGRLKGVLKHRSFRSYAHMIEKINFYSTMQAEDMFAKGRRPSNLRVVVEPFFALFKALFLRGYIRRGVTGFLESIFYAFGRSLRLAKARAMFIEADRKQP